MKTLFIKNRYKSTINCCEMGNKHFQVSRIMHLRNMSVQSRSTRCQHVSRKCELLEPGSSEEGLRTSHWSLLIILLPWATSSERLAACKT